MLLFTSLIADHCTSLFSLSVCLLVAVNPPMHAAIATEVLNKTLSWKVLHQKQCTL